MKFRIGQKFEYTDWYTGGLVNIEVKDISDGSLICNAVYHETDGTHKGTETYEICTDAMGDQFITICELANNFLQIHAVP